MFNRLIISFLTKKLLLSEAVLYNVYL